MFGGDGGGSGMETCRRACRERASVGAEGGCGEGDGGEEGWAWAARCMFEGELAAFELVHDADDVGAGFGVGRDAVVAIDGGGAGVVGGEGEGEAVGVVAGS